MTFSENDTVRTNRDFEDWVPSGSTGRVVYPGSDVTLVDWNDLDFYHAPVTKDLNDEDYYEITKSSWWIPTDYLERVDDDE